MDVVDGVLGVVLFIVVHDEFYLGDVSLQIRLVVLCCVLGWVVFGVVGCVVCCGLLGWWVVFLGCGVGRGCWV
ncbi:hypothetical protein AAHH79_40255, partial [Burkholderia pseudomallei]